MATASICESMSRTLITHKDLCIARPATELLHARSGHSLSANSGLLAQQKIGTAAEICLTHLIDRMVETKRGLPRVKLYFGIKIP